MGGASQEVPRAGKGVPRWGSKGQGGRGSQWVGGPMGRGSRLGRTPCQGVTQNSGWGAWGAGKGEDKWGELGGLEDPRWHPRVCGRGKGFWCVSLTRVWGGPTAWSWGPLHLWGGFGGGWVFFSSPIGYQGGGVLAPPPPWFFFGGGLCFGVPIKVRGELVVWTSCWFGGGALPHVGPPSVALQTCDLGGPPWAPLGLLLGGQPEGVWEGPWQGQASSQQRWEAGGHTPITGVPSPHSCSPPPCRSLGCALPLFWGPSQFSFQVWAPPFWLCPPLHFTPVIGVLLFSHTPSQFWGSPHMLPPLRLEDNPLTFCVRHY